MVTSLLSTTENSKIVDVIQRKSSRIVIEPNAESFSSNTIMARAAFIDQSIQLQRHMRSRRLQRLNWIHINFIVSFIFHVHPTFPTTFTTKREKNLLQRIVHVHASNKSSRTRPRCGVSCFITIVSHAPRSVAGAEHTLQLPPGDRKANQLIFQELDPKVDDCMHIFSSW